MNDVLRAEEEEAELLRDLQQTDAKGRKGKRTLALGGVDDEELYEISSDSDDGRVIVPQEKIRKTTVPIKKTPRPVRSNTLTKPNYREPTARGGKTQQTGSGKKLCKWLCLK